MSTKTSNGGRNQNSIPGPVRLLLLGDFAADALYLLDAALGHPNRRFTRLVDLDGEANLPTWYSSGQLLVLGLLLGLFAIATDRREERSWPFFALAALCHLMSLDEVAQIHEPLGSRVDALLPGGSRQGSLFPRTGIWMFLLGPPFLLVVVFLWRLAAPLLADRKRVVRLYLVGFVVYTASVLGIEILANAVTRRGLASAIQIVCEELGEMLGLTLLVWATVELLASYSINIRRMNH
ncbi:MAG: hypothetical protein ABR576_01220 [Thermoanaerobaculia bacterium]